MSEDFIKASEEAKVLKQTPNKEEMLSLYSLYKQATVGNVNTDQPGIISFVAREKWNAWNTKKGLSKDEAKAEYIKLVNDLKGKYGI